jgi:hypothetical protein
MNAVFRLLACPRETETLTGPLISHPDICRILSNRCRARDNDCSLLFDIRRILHDLLVTLIRRVDLGEILRRRRHPTVHAHSPRLRLKHHQVGTVFPFHAVIAGLVIGRRARLSGLLPGPGGRGRRRRCGPA